MKNKWLTPKWIIEGVEAVFGGRIDLDPCSNEGEPNVPAEKHYTEKDDGLALPWKGNVFMNPPYGRGLIDPWIAKLVREFRVGWVQQAVALLPAKTETNYIQPLRTFPRLFFQGRVKFLNPETREPEGVGTFPSMLVFLGCSLPRVHEAFGHLGSIYIYYEPIEVTPRRPMILHSEPQIIQIDRSAALVAAFADLFDELALDTQEEIDQVLIDAGYDPEALGQRMATWAQEQIATFKKGVDDVR